MENEIKCKICGSVILLGIIVATSYPVCKNCILKLKKHPDIPVKQETIFEPRQLFVAGINSTASTMSFGIFDDDRWREVL